MSETTLTAAGRACRLYLITPAQLDPQNFAPMLEAALAAGDVACLQLRLKDVDDGAFGHAINTLLPIAHGHDVAFLVNDRPDLAALHGCDGVHIGQGDAPYTTARQAIGDDAIVGVTCHDSRDLAFAAAAAGADYVAFGAFHDTDTKPSKYRPSPALLRMWSEATQTPCVAIGGITVENGAVLAQAGADFLAVVSGVWQHPDGPAAAVAAYNTMLDSAAGDVASTEPS